MVLNKEELEKILEFMNKFNKDVVEIQVDNSSGIGSIVTAYLHKVEVLGEPLTLTKIIADESNW